MTNTKKWLGCLTAALMTPAAFGFPVAQLQNGVYYTDANNQPLLQNQNWDGGTSNLLQLIDYKHENKFEAGNYASEFLINMHEKATSPQDNESVQYWMHNFDLVVVVDKATGIESLTAYKNVGTPDNPKPQVVLTTKISSGVEHFGCNPEYDNEGDPANSIKFFGQTPTGFYPIFIKTDGGFATSAEIQSGKYHSPLQIDYFSGKYEDGHMAYAVFFVPQLGVATHAHDVRHVTKWTFGYRHSHGCVRMPSNEAAKLFEQVALTGGPIDPNNSAFHAQCNPDLIKSNPSRCGVDERSREPIYARYVQKMIDDGKAENRPYSTVPMIPEIDRNGHWETDANGNHINVPGFRTLYVIEDSKYPQDLGNPRKASDVRCPNAYEITHCDINPQRVLGKNESIDCWEPSWARSSNQQQQDQFPNPFSFFTHFTDLFRGNN